MGGPRNMVDATDSASKNNRILQTGQLSRLTSSLIMIPCTKTGLCSIEFKPTAGHWSLAEWSENRPTQKQLKSMVVVILGEIYGFFTTAYAELPVENSGRPVTQVNPGWSVERHEEAQIVWGSPAEIVLATTGAA